MDDRGGYLASAPMPLALVEGAEHIVVYANAPFRELTGLAARALNERLADVLGRSGVARSLNTTQAGLASTVTAVVDRVRGDRVAARDVEITDAWRLTAWPVRTRAADPDQLVVELRNANDGDVTLARQRDVAERMLLSALREQTLSEEIERLYRTADANRGIAEDAQYRAERAQDAAEVANATKAQFLANMSHELRTPLNAIGGYAQLIELGLRGPVTKAQLDDLARIQHSQAHLRGLIDEVLSYAQIEGGHMTYLLADVRLDAAIDAASTLIDSQIRARGLTYERRASDGSQAVVVRADPEKLQQILLNLLTNAVKYTEPGGMIMIACGATSSDTGFVSVRDTGRGIPTDKFTSIFDAFVQVNRQLHTAESGVGLGLAISRELALGMGGALEVESVEGIGSTFTLRLPLSA